MRSSSLMRIMPLVLGAFLMLTLGPACGSGSGTEVITESDSFLPNFTFVWADKASLSHTFLFQTDAFDAPSGNFTTDSSENFKGTVSSFQTGSFNHRDLQFTVARKAGVVRFTGRFLDVDTIDLQSPEGRITLIRVRQ